MVGLAKKNVQIRQNSIRNTGVQGASPNNPYAGGGPPQAAATSAAPAHKSGDVVTLKDGRKVTVTKVNPDGTYEGTVAK